MQKKFLARIILAGLLLAALLGLAACGDDNKQAGGSTVGGEGPMIPLAEYPRVDGSTANLPMMAQIMADVTGISLEEAEQNTWCRKTPEAWLALADGNNDLLLVYEAAEVTKQQLAEQGVELTIEPIGRDALVFIVNEDNPVQSLTQEQLIGIYTGEITNWSDVGGADLPIVAFQRPEESGSQSLFMKLLM